MASSLVVSPVLRPNWLRSSSQRPRTPIRFNALSNSNRSPPSTHNALRFSSSFFVDPAFVKMRYNMPQCKKIKKCGGALSSTCSFSFSEETLRWVFSASAALLMLLKNTSINKSFIVPILALQAPRDLIGWIRGEYGIWAAFLALLVRLFYYIPGELELPLVFFLLVITSPHQVLNFRGTAAAGVLCVAIAIYLGYQHISKSGGIRGVFQEDSLVGSLAVVCLVSIPIFFLVQSF